MNKGRDAGRTKIPEWFSLGKYCRAATLDAAGWYRQITVRQVCGSLLRDMRDPNPIFPGKDAVVRHALTSLRAEHTDRVRALQDIEEYEETIEQVDGVRPLVDRTIFDLLWPLAQRGHEIINCNWPKVEAIATELYKTKKLSGDEVQSIMTSSAAAK
jgi:hypothetical protein